MFATTVLAVAAVLAALACIAALTARMLAWRRSRLAGPDTGEDDEVYLDLLRENPWRAPGEP